MCDVITAASMAYYVCFAFYIVLSFFLTSDILNEQLSRLKITLKPTQRVVQKLTFLIIGTGMLTGQINPSYLPLSQKV